MLVHFFASHFYENLRTCRSADVEHGKLFPTVGESASLFFKRSTYPCGRNWEGDMIKMMMIIIITRMKFYNQSGVVKSLSALNKYAHLTCQSL